MCGQAPCSLWSTSDFQDICLGFQGVCILCMAPCVCAGMCVGCLWLYLPAAEPAPHSLWNRKLFQYESLKHPQSSPILFQPLSKRQQITWVFHGAVLWWHNKCLSLLALGCLGRSVFSICPRAVHPGAVMHCRGFPVRFFQQKRGVANTNLIFSGRWLSMWLEFV